MAKTHTLIRVFVASPEDVKEERDALGGVIEELNRTWSEKSGLTLELIKWETHTYPGVGNDAQAVINEQLEDDYDIFIGVMWGKFGTPTGRAGSGTAEEFSRAFKRYKEDPDQLRIMFYFNDTPISPSNLDPQQLGLLKDFKNELGEKGTYYWTYASRDEFEKLVRMHLAHQVQDWGVKWGRQQEKAAKAEAHEKIASVESQTSIAGEESTTDEEGYLDLLESAEENVEAMREATNRMSDALGSLGSRVSERHQELIQAQQQGQEINIRQMKRVSNLVAEEMNSFAGLMEADVPVFSKSYSSAIDDYTRAFTITKDLGLEKKEDVQRAKSSIEQLQVTLHQVKEQMLSLRETISAIPRATTMLNRAKKRTVTILDRLDEKFASASNLAAEIGKIFDQFLSD